jgi:hypothetical protein
MKLLSQECERLNRSTERRGARLPFRALLLTAAAVLMISGSALAADTICTGTLDPAGSPYGNVVVPAGESCSIVGARVNGNVTVFGSLVVAALPSDTTISGDVKSKDGCGTVVIRGLGSTAPEPAPSAGIGRVVVGGNVTIDHCQEGSIGSGGPGAPESALDGIALGPLVLIGKNLKCSNNAGRCTVDHVVIGGNVELSGNSGPVGASVSFVGGNVTANNNGGIDFFENAIGGDLKCNGNASVLGFPNNTVAGNKQGQCAAL